MRRFIRNLLFSCALLMSPAVKAVGLQGESQCSAFIALDGWHPEIGGITLYPIVFFSSERLAADTTMRTHENVHCRQVKQDGVVAFYTNYVRYYAKNRMMGMEHRMAYAAIPYEIEAYAEAMQGEFLREMLMGVEQ